MLGSAGSLVTAAPAHDFHRERLDVDVGGHVEDVKGGKRFIVKQRTETVPGRAELRGMSSTTEITAGGRFRLISGGRWVSILQILNVTAAGKAGGAAKPVAQLAIRLNAGSADRYQFFIVQGGHWCRNVPDFAIGSYHTISVSVKAGGDPRFRIDGVECAYANPDGSKAGTIRGGGNLASTHYFYAKLGAYQINSNQRHEGGGSAVEWTNIYI